MPFISVGAGDDLILQIPTNRTTNWGANFKDNFAQVVAEHDHSGSGRGRLLSGTSIANDSLNGSKLLLLNEEYLRGRNAADSANINIIKVNNLDNLTLGAKLSNLITTNNVPLSSRNAADSAYIDVIKLNNLDQIELGSILTNLRILNSVSLKGRNVADNADINIIQVNGSDKLLLGADLANLDINNDTYLRARDFADSGYINILKVKTDDSLEVVPNVALTGNLTLNSNKLVITPNIALNDGQATTDLTGVTVTETTGKAYKMLYRIYVDATSPLVEHGDIMLSYDGTTWDFSRKYTHDDSLVTLSVLSGNIQYSTPSYAGFVSASITYQLIEL